MKNISNAVCAASVSTAMLSISDNRYVILFIINILLLIIGTFMDLSLIHIYFHLPRQLQSTMPPASPHSASLHMKIYPACNGSVIIVDYTSIT